MWILLLFIYGQGPAVTTQEFGSETLCLKAIEEVVKWEKTSYGVKATCVRKE